LAAAVVALSLVKPEKLSSAMTAIAVGLAELVGAMAILNKTMAGGGFATIAKLPAVAAAMILLAAAIDILSLAVLGLSQLSWEDLGKGLAGVLVLLAGVSAASIPLSKAGPGMIAAGVGLVALAAGLLLLSASVAIFSKFSWEELGKGLAAVAAALVIVAAAANLIPPGSMLALGVGLVGVGFGMNILAGALKILSKFSWEEIGKGLAATAGLLLLLGVAASLIPPGAFLAMGAGLIVAGIGLNEIAAAMRIMGGMSWSEIGKGLVAIGGALLVLAVGLTAMIVALPGAAALVLAAVGLNAIIPAIALMGHMDWGTILKGLAGIAVSLLAISLVGAIAAPGLLAFGAALVVVGGGVAAVGAGFYLIAKASQILATDGAKAIGVFIAAVTAFFAALPGIIVNFLNGMVQVLDALVSLAPKVATALGQILEIAVQFIIANAPKFAQAAIALITAFLDVIVAAAPKLINAGISIFMSFLRGVEQNIGQIARTVANIITKFLNALTAKVPQISRAGANLIIALMDGVATQGPRIQAGAVAAFGKFVAGVLQNIGRLLSVGAQLVARLASGIAGAIGRLVSNGAQAVARFVSGILSAIGRVASAGTNLVARLASAIGSAISRLLALGVRAMSFFVAGILSAIGSAAATAASAAVSIGKALGQGVVNGIKSMAGAVASAAGGLAKGALGAMAKFAGIASPSKVTHQYGIFIVQGLANGMSEETQEAAKRAEDAARAVMAKIAKTTGTEHGPSTITEKIGRFVGQGFAKGMVGSQEDIRNAWQTLNQKLTEAMQNARQTIKTEEDKLKEERKKSDPDEKVIAKAQAAVEKNEEILKRSSAAHDVLTKKLKDEKAELLSLAGDYQKVSDKLEAAKQALEDAIKTRDDAQASYADKYSDKPDIDADAPDQLAAYSQAIIDQTTAVATYKDTLDQLRALGLDDDTYKKLLEDGTADQQFASQLLAGGKTAVEGLNTLDAQLDKVSGELATNAAHNLYQAGVDAAQGLVKGLKSQQSELRQVMQAIADEMVRAIRQRLKMKSPSRVFAEIGKFSVLGMAQGLQENSSSVVDAASQIGDDALLAMRDSMAHISDAVANEIDVNPTITPILDLSQVQKGAKSLSDITAATPISVAGSLGLASLVDTEQSSSDDVDPTAGASPTLQFIQNNTSPKSLSETEIYRQTNNQLSQAKSALEKLKK
jgi:phage-related protein